MISVLAVLPCVFPCGWIPASLAQDVYVVDGSDPWSRFIQHYSETACSYEVEFTCIYIRSEAIESNTDALGLLTAYQSEGRETEGLDYPALSEMCASLVSTTPEGVHVVPGVSYRVVRQGGVTLQECLHDPAINEVRTADLIVTYTSPLGSLTVARNDERVALNTPETILRPMPSRENAPVWLQGTWKGIAEASYERPQSDAGAKTVVRFSSPSCGLPVAFWTRSSPLPYHVSAGFYGWEKRIVAGGGRSAPQGAPQRAPRLIGSIHLSQSEKVLSVFWYRVTGYTEEVEPQEATLIIHTPGSILDLRGGGTEHVSNVASLPEEVRRLILVLDDEDEGGSDHSKH